jgi:drug/metabolite transporter (DMT)-like permease
MPCLVAKEQRLSRRGWTLFAVMSVIWGIPYLLIKVADGGVSVPVLVWSRVTLGALLLVPIALYQGTRRPGTGSQLAALRALWPWLAAFAVVEIIAPWALLSTAERRLPSSTSGLLIAAVPVIGAILAWLLGTGDRPTLVRWTGLAAGFGGVALLAGPGAGRGDLVSVAEALLTAVCYAVGPMIANRKLAGVPSISVNAVALSIAAVVYTPAAILTWPHAMPDAQVLASLAGLGVVCTAAGLVLFFALIAEVGPARALVITYVNPAVAVALGAIILGERLTPEIGVAFVLILGGSVLATRGGQRRERRAVALGRRRPSMPGALPDPREPAQTSAPEA